MSFSNLNSEMLGNIMTQSQIRKTNPQHSRDLARLSKTSKDMNFLVKDRYPVMDPLQFHAIVNNPRISRAAQRYRLRFSEPYIENVSVERGSDGTQAPLYRHIKLSMDDQTN
eukprot:SAG11_NODE_20715_length_439_cov_2.435294_2_plen_111_part_01